MKSILLATGLLILILMSSTTQAKSLALTSLNWPPYTGSSLKDLGVTSKIVALALYSVGLELNVVIFPWQRAVLTAKSDKNFQGYFPEYYDQAIEKEFFFSDPVGSSPLGFIERKDKPVTWETLDDLKGLRIGTVKGYVNTAEFDAKVASGALDAEAVVDDVTNVKKLAAGRLDIAVIDKYVYEYLLNTDPELAPLKAKLHFNSRILENKKLYVCLRRDPEGEAALEQLNQGLKYINVSKIQDMYIRKALDLPPLDTSPAN